MDFWRDTASAQAQDDLDELVNPALGFAQQLEKHGKFYPYAIVVDADGEKRMVAAEVDSDQPASADVLATLIDGLCGDRDNLRATAIMVDVHLPEEKTDAVQVTLEHSELIALTVLLPYKTRRFRRGVEYGEIQAGRASALVWAED